MCLKPQLSRLDYETKAVICCPRGKNCYFVIPNAQG